VAETDKPLRVLCAEAEGWTGCVQFDGSDRWWGWPPRLSAPGCEPFKVESTLEELPLYGDDSLVGRALAIELMQTHKISVVLDATPLPCSRWGAHAWEHEPAMSAWGATIAEAVAWCRVEMKRDDRD
jgi:hypothetical protein